MKFSTLAHRDHRFLGPLHPDKVERLFALLPLESTDLVLDVGCGKGEMLIRLVERFGVSAIGIDPNATFLAEAQTEATVRGVADRIVLHHASYADVPLPSDRFALAVAAGAGAAFQGYRDELQKLAHHVRSGGHLVIGEGYWRREPDAGYLAALGAKRDEMTDLSGTLSAARDEGLEPLYVSVSSEDDWDHYEGLYHRGVREHVAAHPDDPDRNAMIARIGAWQDAYWQWGRETLGFALVLLRKP